MDDDRERPVFAGQIIKTEDRQRIQKEKRMVLQALDKEDENCEHYDPWRQHGIGKFLHINTFGPDHRFTARGRVKMNSEPTPAVLITSMFSPWAWMISFTMERPSPVPFLSFPLERSDL